MALKKKRKVISKVRKEKKKISEITPVVPLSNTIPQENPVEKENDDLLSKIANEDPIEVEAEAQKQVAAVQAEPVKVVFDDKHPILWAIIVAIFVVVVLILHYVMIEIF